MTKLARASLQILLLVAATLVLDCPTAVAKCMLPISDGGSEGYVPSKENLWGDIEKVELPFVYIKSGKSSQVVKVSLSKIKEAYTVYGGNGPLSELQPRLQVWVWFENCRSPKRGVPNVAYFEFFSSNPNDRATLDNEGRIVKVP